MLAPTTQRSRDPLIKRSQSLRTHQPSSSRATQNQRSSGAAIAPDSVPYKRSRRRSQSQVAMSSLTDVGNVGGEQVRQTYFPPFEEGGLTGMELDDGSSAKQRANRSTRANESAPASLPTSPRPSHSAIEPTTNPTSHFARTHRRARTDPIRSGLPHVSEKRMTTRSAQRGDDAGKRDENYNTGNAGVVAQREMLGAVVTDNMVKSEPPRTAKRKNLSADLRASISERLLSSFSPVSTPIIGSLLLARDTARATIHNLASTSTEPTTEIAAQSHKRPRPRPPPLRDLPPPSWSSPGPSPPLTSLAPPFSTDLFIFPFLNPITHPPQPLAAGGFFDNVPVSPPRSPPLTCLSDLIAGSGCSSNSMAVDDTEEDIEHLMPDEGRRRQRRRSSMSSLESCARTIRPWDGDGELTPKPSLAQLSFEREQRESKVGALEECMPGENQDQRERIRGRTPVKPKSNLGRRRSKSDLSGTSIRRSHRSRDRSRSRQRDAAEDPLRIQGKDWVRSDRVGSERGVTAPSPGWWGWLGSATTNKDNAA